MSGAGDTSALAPTGDEEPLVPREAAKSTVWSFFGFRASDIDQKDVICKECHRVVSAPKGNTTNLFNHLKTHHKQKYDELREALASWSLREEKQVCITTDNGSNVIKAASLNKWMRLQCFGHRLHLAIENAMKDPRIDRAVGICKKLVSSFSYSWRRKKELARAQKELKLPEHGLKTECPTRWGSRQAMIERVLEQHKAISQVLSSDRKSRHLLPSWQDTEILEAIYKSLHPLTEFTDALSSEKYVSVSFVKPVLHLFTSSILKVNDDDPELTNTIKTKILTYLEEKYKDPETQDLLNLASALDPRFKLRYTSEDRVAPIQARLMSEMAASLSMGPSDGGTADRAEDDAPSTSKKKKTLGSFFKITERARPTHPPQQALATELQSYLQCADLDSEENPLDWWREHQRVYPRLSKLAKKYLGIPATSAPSERVFSTGGNIVTCLRSSLKPESVDRLVFLAKNL
ncbi:E3 SUMO-protein ligase ZBED1-like isoform 2-T2 [Acanthopagrus schlegelii]